MLSLVYFLVAIVNWLSIGKRKISLFPSILHKHSWNEWGRLACKTFLILPTVEEESDFKSACQKMAIQTWG